MEEGANEKKVFGTTIITLFLYSVKTNVKAYIYVYGLYLHIYVMIYTYMYICILYICMKVYIEKEMKERNILTIGKTDGRQIKNKKIRNQV